MESKEIISRNKFQDNVVKSVDILADIVTATLGPNGLPILLERKGQAPLSTKDGVTVANSVFVDDPNINIIIQSIKEASLNTNAIAGDGTTTAILLTQAFIKESQIYLKTKAITPQLLGDSLIEASKDICDYLSNLAIKVNDNPEKIKDIAYISSNGDSEISNVVFDAIDAVGTDGVITLGDSLNGTTSLEVVEGFSIDRGYGHLGSIGVHLVNNKLTQEVIYENPKIILFDSVIDDVIDLAAGLSKMTCNATIPMKIVIMAHDFSIPALHMIFANVSQGSLHLIPVKIPKLGSQFSQSSVLEDIAALTGGQVLQPSVGITMKDIANKDSEYLGSADKIICARNTTYIYGGKGTEKGIQDRAEIVRSEMNAAKSEWDKDIVKERLGRLLGGIAVIGVSSTTDLEAKEKKDRIEDALNATRAALLEGVVPGGGSALLSAFYFYIKNNSSYKEKVVYSILEKAFEYPLRKIISNGGKQSADVVLNKILSLFENNETKAGYNARANKVVENMITEGVIDPVKVIKTALSNAASIASMLLRGGGSIVTITKDSKEPPFYINEDE